MHLETEIACSQKCIWWPGSSEVGDALRGHGCANLQAEIEWVWRYPWRPWSSVFEVALGGRDRTWLEMHLEALLVRTWRMWSSQFGIVIGAGRWTACRVLKRYSSVSQVATVRMWQGHFPFELSWRAGWWLSIGRHVRRKLKLHSGVNSKSWALKDNRQS